MVYCLLAGGKTMTNTKKRPDIRGMVYIALFAVLMAVCSWISIPATVPFTLQTFAVFAATGLLGGKRGTLAICLYILLGMVGIPVFAGFSGGPGCILGPTGGYIVGFALSAAVVWAVTAKWGRKTLALILSMGLGLAVCYAFGTAWFMAGYARQSGAIGWGTALAWCVVPFILPDCAKIALAIFVTKRLERFMAKGLGE